LKVLAHNDYIGRIIGKQGNIINTIKTETETTVTVSSIDDIAMNVERVITVKGDLENMIKALEMIHTKVKSAFENDTKTYGAHAIMMSGISTLPLVPSTFHPNQGMVVPPNYLPYPTPGQVVPPTTQQQQQQNLIGRQQTQPTPPNQQQQRSTFTPQNQQSQHSQKLNSTTGGGANSTTGVSGVNTSGTVSSSNQSSHHQSNAAANSNITNGTGLQYGQGLYAPLSYQQPQHSLNSMYHLQATANMNGYPQLQPQGIL
jgi:hypothetical protein